MPSIPATPLRDGSSNGIFSVCEKPPLADLLAALNIKTPGKDTVNIKTPAKDSDVFMEAPINTRSGDSDVIMKSPVASPTEIRPEKAPPLENTESALAKTESQLEWPKKVSKVDRLDRPRRAFVRNACGLFCAQARQQARMRELRAAWARWNQGRYR